jgi:ParB family chromosome partitioning protein
VEKTSDPVTHELKIRPEFFSAVRSGDKRFELRKDDRGFKVGDRLVLREWDDNGYSGEQVCCRIDYILKGYAGLDECYAILSITLIGS